MDKIQRSIVVMSLVSGLGGTVVAGGQFSPPVVVGGMAFIAAFIVGHVARERGWDDALRYQKALDEALTLGALSERDLGWLSGSERSTLRALSSALGAQAESLRLILRRLDYDFSSMSMGVAVRESTQTDVEAVIARARGHISAAGDALRLASAPAPGSPGVASEAVPADEDSRW